MLCFVLIFYIICIKIDKVFTMNNIELKPIVASIADLETRLDEFNSILQLTRDDSKEMGSNMQDILRCKVHFQSLCKKILQLESFVKIVGKNLEMMEHQIEIAEQELDIPERKIDIILKSINIFSKPKKETNLVDGKYEVPVIFKTEEFFLNH